MGDSNVTIGKPFRIQCLSKVPIEWHKDGKPIEEHFVRHSKKEFNYVRLDVSKDNDMIESTLSVNHALLRHSGKYKCNIHHLNSHMLYVNRNTESIEMSVFDDNENEEEDHLEVRVSFEQPVGEDNELKSTMMIFVEEISEPNNRNLETDGGMDYDSMYSEIEEKVTDETTTRQLTTTLPSTTITTLSPSTLPKHFDKIKMTSTTTPEPTDEPTTNLITSTSEPIITTQHSMMKQSKGSHESL